MAGFLRAFPDITWENMAISETHDRRVQHVNLARQVTPQLAQRTADLGFYYPQVPGGVITGMAQAGIEPGSPEADMIRDRSQELADAGFGYNPKPTSFWDQGFGRGIKGFTRGAFTLFESVYDEVTKGTSAFFYGLGQGKGIEEAAESAYGYSTGAIALASALQGRPVNLGSGFFSGGDLSAETQAALDRGVPYQQAIQNQAQMEMGLPAKQHSLDYQQRGYQKIAGTEDIVDPNTGIRGLTLTPGRFVASGVTEPGTRAFSNLSGLIDLGANIFLDPANAAGGWLGDVRQLNHALVAGGRKTVLTRHVDDWLASAHGARTAQFIADTDDYRLLHGLFRKNAVESNVDANLIYRLQQEKDPDRVREILSNMVSGGSKSQLKSLPVSQGLIGRATGTSGLGGIMAKGMGFGDAGAVLGLRQTIKANRQTTSWFGRMAAEVGANYLRFDDVSTAVDDLGQWLQAAGVDPDKISAHMSQMASIQPGSIATSPQMWGAFKAAGHTVAQKMIDQGLDAEIANTAVRAFTGKMSDYQKFWINEAGNPTMFAGSEWFQMVNGQIQAIPSAQLFSEFLTHGIPLPDMRRIRNGLRRAKWAEWNLPGATKKLESARKPNQILPRFKLREMEGWNDLGPGVLTNLTDKVVQGVWKPLVLLRIAWPVRVVAEEQVRMGAIGLSSAINHPLQYLGLAFGRNMAEDISGNAFTELSKFRAAQSRKGVEYGMANRSRSPYSSEYLKVDQNHPRYWDGSAINLQKVADDPLTKRIAIALHEMEPGQTIEDALRPIKEEFATPGTELGDLRLALAADSTRWDVVNIRELSDSLVDDRLARLAQHGGGTYVKANHITGEYEDAWGNLVRYDPSVDAYVNQVTHEVYQGLPTPERGSFPVSMFPEMVDRSSTLNNMVDRIAAAQGGPVTDDIADIGEWVDALEDMSRTLDLVDDPQARRLLEHSRSDFGEPNELATWIDRHHQEILEGDPETLVELTRRADDLRQLLNEARDFGVRIQAPSGRASRRAVETIQMAGDPERVRQTLAGYVPQPGQPSLDELANKTSWTPNEIIDMIGPDSAPIGPYRVKPMPKSMVEAHGEDTHIWTEYINPAHPEDGEMIQIAHDGIITGHLILEREAGEITDVKMFHVAKANERTVWFDSSGISYDAKAAAELGIEGRHLPGERTDAGRLLQHALGSDDIEVAPEQMYDLAFGGVSIRDWLESAGHSPEGLTMADMAEFMRAQLGATWAGKSGPLGDMPSIALTNDGAAALAGHLIRMGKRDQATKGVAASWPQRGITTHVVRPPKPELLEAVATGKLGDHKLSALDLLDDSESVAHIDAISGYLRENYANQIADFPTYTRVAAEQDTSKLDNAVDHIFNVLGSRPTNKLSRSPAFRQFYYKRVGELLPYVDNATRDELVKIMRDQGVRRAEIKAAVKKAIDHPGANDLGKADVDEIAKAFALQETKRLLYDLSKKSQFFDITRNIFPFGEAWLEIMTTWTRIINENPNVIRRIQQGIEGARHEGIFYNDPATGEEVFAMPHLNALSSAIGIAGGTEKATPEFTGRVEGVNLVLNSFLPGVGPVVQMPAAAIGRDLFDKPELRWARDLVFPFGYPEADSPGAIVNSVMPAWFRKALTAMGKPTGDDARLYGNTVIDVLRAMELNGEITPQTNPAEAIETARSRARKIYVLRFAQQFIGPTGASVRWDVEVDPEGEAFAYQVLATEYRQMIEDNDGDRTAAFKQFTDTFGFDPAAIATAKTESVRPRGVTSQALDFQQQNPKVFSDFPLTAYYLAPDPPDGEFSYNAYLAQLRNGDRVGLSADQWLTERNRLLGSIAYEKLRRTAVDFGVRNEPAVAAFLRSYRYGLMETYPGYGFDNVGAVTQPEQRQFMAEFNKWRDDPKMLATNAGAGLDRYLRVRDQVLSLADVEFGVSEEGFATASSTSMLREFLLNSGQAIMAEYPDFGVIFQRHYLWEVETPESLAPTELLGLDLSRPPDEEEDEL